MLYLLWALKFLSTLLKKPCDDRCKGIKLFTRISRDCKIVPKVKDIKKFCSIYKVGRRPASILKLCFKVFEKLIQKQLNPFLIRKIKRFKDSNICSSKNIQKTYNKYIVSHQNNTMNLSNKEEKYMFINQPNITIMKHQNECLFFLMRVIVIVRVS